MTQFESIFRSINRIYAAAAALIRVYQKFDFTGCCVEEAEFLGRYILGTNVPVGMWLITTPHNQTTRTTVLQENCVPIAEEIYMSKGGRNSGRLTVFAKPSI